MNINKIPKVLTFKIIYTFVFMSDKQINPHDKFFKEVFSRKAEVQSFMKGFLPKHILENINLSSLKLETNSYIDEKLKESFSDICYECVYGNENIKISLLFEHKTYQDKYIYLQLLRYMLNIWENDKKQKRQLVPVLPIIIYHGKKEWKLKSFSEYFPNLPNEFLTFIPKFTYLIQDLQKKKHEEIEEKYQSIILQSSFLVMKDIFHTLALIQNLSYIFKKIYSINDDNFDKKFIISLFHYLYYTNSEDNFVKIKEKIEQIPNTNKDMITIAESFINQGIQKGIQKGIVLGRQEKMDKIRQETIEQTACSMLLKGFDVETIQDILKIPIEKIIELKQIIEEKE